MQQRHQKFWRWMLGWMTMLWAGYSTQAYAAQKTKSYALLVGISEYRVINSLKWPEHDVNRMARALGWYGFQKKDIRILKSAQATKAAMIREMLRLQRIAQPGDRVVFYYSGHGSQVKDVDDPKNGLVLDEPDGIDETLAPYDATLGPQTHIVDDWIAQWTKGFRTRNLVLIFDSCHSGGMSKSGLAKLEGRARFWENPAISNLSQNLSDAMARRIRVQKRKVDLLKNSEHYVALMASRAEERAWESKRVGGGLFTTLLIRAMQRMKKSSSATFEHAYKQIAQEIQKEPFRKHATYQHPRFVGMAAAKLFFHDVPEAMPQQYTSICSKETPGFCVKMWVNAKRGSSGRMELAAGKKMLVSLQANQACRIELWVQSTEGKTAQVFPNRLDAAFTLRPRKKYHWPPRTPRNAEGRRYVLRAKGPEGPVRVWAVVSSRKAQRARSEQVNTRGDVVFEEVASRVKPLRVGVSFWVVD